MNKNREIVVLKSRLMFEKQGQFAHVHREGEERFKDKGEGRGDFVEPTFKNENLKK